MSELTFDVNLAYEIKRALSRNDITDTADLDWLATRDNIAKIRLVRLGHAEIVIPEYIIDCDIDPFVPDGWEVIEHRRSSTFKWDKNAQKDTLYYSKSQQDDKWIGGGSLRKELEDKTVLNANVLDYLLTNQHLIPEKWWKGKWGNKCKVAFWGTIYRDNDWERRELRVRALSRWGNGTFYWCAPSVECLWYDDTPAVVATG